MSFLTNTNCELIYKNSAVGTSKNTFTSEANINDAAGMGGPPILPANFFYPGSSGPRTLGFIARGLVSAVSATTPTWLLTLRAAATVGATSGAILLGQAATFSSGSGLANKLWEMEGQIQLVGNPASSTASTIRGTGIVTCPSASANVTQELWGGAAQPGTVTNFDTTVSYFLALNATCGTSNGSNAIQVLAMMLFGLD